MDTTNTLKQHIFVGIFSMALAFIFKYLLNSSWTVSFARVSYILLFLILIIGPFMRLKKPEKVSSPLFTPWSWRGELGIWFTITALIHFVILLTDGPLSTLIKIGGSGYALTNFIGLVALLLSLVLAATSSGKAIKLIGVQSWHWLHSLTYTIFYLVSAHFIYFQFFSAYGDVGPDWFGYFAATLSIIVIILQFATFILAVKKHRKEIDSPK